MRVPVAGLALAALLLAAAPASADGLGELSPAGLDRRAHDDARLLKEYGGGVTRLLGDLVKHDPIWRRPETQALGPDERRLALQLFQQVLAYEVALDGMARFHLDFWKIDALSDPTRHARHFALGYAAYCTQLALGLTFIDRTQGKAQFEKLLDEGAPEEGIPPGAYAKLKWNVVHVQDLGRVFAAHQYHKLLGLTSYKRLVGDALMKLVLDQIDARYAVVKAKLTRSGAGLFAGNGLDILKDGGHKAWFPLQTEIAERLGDTRTTSQERALISPAQIAEVIGKTRPGDVIVERRNWYLSNLGLPGFWPHTALWLGSPAELAASLDADPEVVAKFGGPFTELLKRKFPAHWATYASPDEKGQRRIIEAVSEGVVFASAEHSISADYAAAMRPRLSKLEIATAIERAFGYAGRPYDFDFDFFTDRELVCSELVFKSYEPRAGVKGLKLDLVQMVGRMTLPPNTMIAQFDREFGTPGQQLDFVWFLDGREKTKRADWGDARALRQSCRRPKWDIVQK